MKHKELSRGHGVDTVTDCKFCNSLLSKKQIQYHQKFCSHDCYSKNKTGVSHSWGEKISEKLKGKPKSRQHIENVSAALSGRKRPEITGEKHFRWKGAKVGYDALHDWVARHLGRPKKCSVCGENNPRKMYHWANLSGKYKRDLSDWMRMCVPCHSRHDRSR